jgi:hypothetical protein
VYVNGTDVRFLNEDLRGDTSAISFLAAGRLCYPSGDEKYPQEIEVMPASAARIARADHPLDPAGFAHAVEKDYVLTGKTIEELGEKMGVPLETFKATVKRYNELARSGRDLDFGKHPDRLTTLEKPLYYACKMEPRLMVVLSGLKINTRLQVLDTEGQPIPGLYAAGNTSGSFFGGNLYSTTTRVLPTAGPGRSAGWRGRLRQQKPPEDRLCLIEKAVLICRKSNCRSLHLTCGRSPAGTSGLPLSLVSERRFGFKNNGCCLPRFGIRHADIHRSTTVKPFWVCSTINASEIRRGYAYHSERSL